MYQSLNTQITINKINMETPKYYTPQIEEFHAGFEYEEESISKLMYNKKIFRFNWFDLKKEIVKGLDDNKIRVKFLDKEDIESLGFDNYTPPREYDHTWHFKNSREPKLKAWFNNPIPVVRIYSSFPAVQFQGTIKNKSELKRLMQQLQIEIK